MRLRSLALRLAGKLDASKRAAIRRLVEAADGDDAMGAALASDVPEPAAGGDADDALFDGFMSAASALVADALRGDTSALKRIGKLCKAYQGLSDGDEAGDDGDGNDEAEVEGVPAKVMAGAEGVRPRPPARGRPIPERRSGAVMTDEEFLARLNR